MYAPLPAGSLPDAGTTPGCMAGCAPPYDRRFVLGGAALACAALLVLGVFSSYAVMVIGATVASAFGVKAVFDVCADAARGGAARWAEVATPPARRA